MRKSKKTAPVMAVGWTVHYEISGVQALVTLRARSKAEAVEKLKRFLDVDRLSASADALRQVAVLELKHAPALPRWNWKETEVE